MNRPHAAHIVLLLLAGLPNQLEAQPAAAASAAFDAYVAALETRITEQHRFSQTFLARPDASSKVQLQDGAFHVEQVTPAGGEDLPGAILHHWRASTFIPGASAAAFQHLLADVPAYPNHFGPQIVTARVVTETDPDHLLISLRVRQTHVLTVVMDATYAVTFYHLGPGQGASSSRSTRIAEIESPGTASEHALSPQQEHGFLWRSNTYWTWQQRDGGLYLQLESVSLTRSIPTGLGWAVRPFLQSVPRDTLEFTLHSAPNALRH